MRTSILSMLYAALALVSTDAGPAQRTGANVAIVFNDADATSVEIARYYQKARGVPERNLVRVTLHERAKTLTPDQFRELKEGIESTIGDEVDVVLFAWTTPYAVACNSITAAFTLGLDLEQCANTCAAGKPSRYFDASSQRPYAELGMRLSMLLPTHEPEVAKAVIDRGRLSGFRTPQAHAYFVVTPDRHRNARAHFFPPSQRLLHYRLTIETIRAESIRDKRNVMFYLTGAVKVPHLDTIDFAPGALADHLTSAGGVLLGESQMSSWRWLEAGATASYGTVSEPCNHWQKFPQPSVLLKHYLAGDSAVETYWKSVAWPAQGLFIGEPLAAPYARLRKR